MFLKNHAFTRLFQVLTICLMLSSCSSFGPDRVTPDRFNYNQAIGQSANEQMLLNLVRLRYRDVPVFLEVSSVLAQYVFLGNVNVSGSGGSDGSIGGGGAGVTYIDRPTITYSPLTGEEFASQMLTPIPSEAIFSLVQSGWPAKQLMMMSFDRLNHLENTSFGRPLTNDQVQDLTIFQRTIELIVKLAKRQGLESQEGKNQDLGERYLIFNQNPDPETRALIDELKEILGLHPQHFVFRITDRLIERQSDEITIRVRSLLTMMGFLSHGVEVPADHMSEAFVESNTDYADIERQDTLVPLKIHSSEDKPEKAFVAVEYQDYWFYIEHSDHASKQAFGLLTYLFLLQAPQPPAGAPLITIPAG